MLLEVLYYLCLRVFITLVAPDEVDHGFGAVCDFGLDVPPSVGLGAPDGWFCSVWVPSFFFPVGGELRPDQEVLEARVPFEG